MIKPVLQDEAFLEVVRAARADRDHLHIWWLGQSGYLVQWQGAHLLIDPYLSDSLTKKYEATNKPHVRMTEGVIAPERLDFIDVVTSSHNHTDHLDGETLIPLLAVNPGLQVIIPRANVQFAAERLKVPPTRLIAIGTDGEPIQSRPFTFYSIPSAHENLETDENGDHRFTGLLIRLGAWTIYHSGDCIPYEGLTKRLRQWEIDIALLPINGRDPARGVAGNFTTQEAVRLAKEVRAGLLFPCHYEMFEFNTAEPQEFAKTAETAGQAYRVLRCGERFTAQRQP